MRRLLTFFARRANKSVPSSGDSADDWQAGDLAECVAGGTWFRAGRFLNHCGPQLGEVRVVSAAMMLPHCATGLPAQFLAFQRYGSQCFEAASFRKIQPRAEDCTAADESFLADLTRQPVHAS